MALGELLGWLSMLHYRREYRKLTYPETPALARLVQYPNYFDFTEDTYREVVLLGRVSGVTYSQYVRRFGVHDTRPGSHAANPITLDDEADDIMENDEETAQTTATNPGSSSAAFWTDEGGSVNWTSEDSALPGQFSSDTSRQVSGSITSVDNGSVGAASSVGSLIQSQAFTCGR
ncbi:hypothetical protein KC19_3G063000 [Ceratodon purpureus]|uniref:Uncharacterized protein n=1 Tax=Ceratodon purpureus TaxID=3225 RepID=A0A8T0IHI9_CERPU|nr:hypothetical protein KC19_3G063000 [Ceratodon purpureus]